MRGLMDRIVEGESDIDFELKKIGAAHATLNEEYGMGTRELEHFGEILVDSFYKLDGIRQSKETSKAWRVLIASIIDNVRVGFDTELRAQRRKSSFTAIPRNSSRRRSMPSPRKLSTSLTVDCSVSRKLSHI
uniref:GLOBIN domain-containing protein n=1 Tax=Steinernema glaseri TaxID=37863 RepID=A0A1I7Y0Z9_9BILA